MPHRGLVCGLLAAVLSGPSCAPRAAAEAVADAAAGLYPSVLLFHKPHHINGPEQVRRAADLGFRKVHIVVTLHCELSADFQVQRFGTLAGQRFVPLTDDSLGRFLDSLRRTFAAAADEQLEVAITAHLNAAGAVVEWRNHMRFDPLADYEGFSYQTALIDSIAAAAAAELPADAHVSFSLCGEMGRSVFEHPQSYAKVIDDLRARTTGPQWQLGVSLNFTEVAGEARPTERRQAGMSALLAKSDFLGLSDYRPFDLPPDARGFALAVRELYAALDAWGVAGHRDLPLEITEVGLGGGAGGNQPALSPAEAAQQPWEGVASARRNPWITDEMRGFRRAFHAALLEFLTQPPADTPVRDAYMWSELSWDPLDLVDRGFADEEIAAAIRAHNDTVRGSE